MGFESTETLSQRPALTYPLIRRGGCGACHSMNVLSPCVQFFVGAVALLSAMVTVDRLYHYYVTAYFKWIIRKDPLDEFPATPLPPDMVYAYARTPSPASRCELRLASVYHVRSHAHISWIFASCHIRLTNATHLVRTAQERYWKLYPNVVVTLPMFNEEHVRLRCCLLSASARLAHRHQTNRWTHTNSHKSRRVLRALGSEVAQAGCRGARHPLALHGLPLLRKPHNTSRPPSRPLTAPLTAPPPACAVGMREHHRRGL
jgi:hypothetical protein